MTALVWFRRDLRVRDHPALRAALDEHDEVVPVFCLDDRLLHGRHASGPRTQFMLECLADLRRVAARARRRARDPPRARPSASCRGWRARPARDAVYFTRDVSPFARERGDACTRARASTASRRTRCPG